MDTSLANGFRRAIPYRIAPERARASFALVRESLVLPLRDDVGGWFRPRMALTGRVTRAAEDDWHQGQRTRGPRTTENFRAGRGRRLQNWWPAALPRCPRSLSACRDQGDAGRSAACLPHGR